MILTEFVVFPDAQDNDTLLGVDFLVAAGLAIDFDTSTWRYQGSERVFPLEFEYPSDLTPCSAADFLREDEGTMLCPPERDRLATLLQCNEDIFRPGGDPTPYAEHRIDTGDHAPISVPPYRLTPARREVMKTELDKMLADGIIEECESAWTSPAVLVPKKDNGIRFCVDYRKLNAVTKTDNYPLPLIDELLQLTKRHCFMTSIDLKAGYWQVQVRPADRDKTAFITPFGTFRFTRMPFGLKNAPSTFQRLIDRFRSGSSLQGIVLLAYLDDLLIISEDFESHLEDLRKVFERLRLFGLRANRAKCFFARPEINYLGHVITPEGIKPDPSKVDAVLQMASPRNLKHLKSFLQTCSWFRKFIPNFSQVAQPLTKLTRKNESWRWDSQQQEAFQCLKDRLTSAPILVQADYTKPFVLRTDASNYALGAVLLQGEGIDEKPIEYASRLLIPAEKNYTTTEKEALAVVWATDKFRGYLDGHPVYVKSDHQPLKWLLTLKTPNGRLIRWAMKLQALDIHYEYTPGKANVVADTLSRPQCDDTILDSCDVCNVIVDLPRISSADLRTEQLDDPEVAKIITSLEDPEPVSTQWLDRGYLMNQGVLYRYLPDSDSDQPQLVVPITMREKILQEFHDAPTAGHQGVERTFNRISHNYYFVGMRKYIADYLKNCEECQRYKASNQKPFGLLQTPVLNQRGEVLAIDLFGPLPEGERGEKWVLLVEDTATRWVELFALREATAEVCAPVLINEYFLRYGFPRRIISDNGVQFISATMQQCMFILGIKQNLIPLYHPEANPAERKNRDLRTQLSILVKNEHRSWPKFLSSVRFSMNSATCATTGASPAQVMFAREMRTPFDAQRDFRGILDKENFLPQITPYLRRFLDNWDSIRDRAEHHQDDRKLQSDKSRLSGPSYQVGDLVLLSTHLLSDAAKGRTKKFMPKRDGPYQISNIGWNEIPEIFASTGLGLVGIGLGVLGAYNYVKNDGDNRRYKGTYVVMRPDDPRVKLIRKE
ncbi:retrovirus-related Pol polyprotein from transposon 17.6 [Bombyx mori]|uniref:retrovirus-related Pol polyprotein from transposon 17.6 n=1 Tax=Bombyx mori TaxID=7091 RepID=UPI002ED4600E